ncbi:MULTISPECIES: flagellar protein FlaG [unclassified Psychrobacillus]|uniref:flagellar protein FlaG n=1 Tax=unclassified Psychrobacillus TaxID=2636677 RepID=UPI001244AE59|nr:flagellar protein FlaG [Psychrobacillus sp. AK 1817]QEY20487.1 flagellar biosynthesis protein FlaG [Psychrobacillus sp. AK 1817]
MRLSAQAQPKDVRITSQLKTEVVGDILKSSTTENSLREIMQAEQKANEKELIPKEKVQKAVDALNEFITIQNRNSKFIMHDGLDRYYVEVIDAETEEVIREVPPRKLLDAFYTMQKFLGMIIDEKI